MITIVSGLPRSGTSLVMQMLKAADYPIYWNREPNYDAQNPRGYYEWQEQKSLWQSSGERQTDLWGKVEGKIVKVFPQCFPCLSPAFKYQIVYIERPVGEVAASQRQMQCDLNRDPAEIIPSNLEKLRFHALLYCAALPSVVIRHADLFTIYGPRYIENFLSKGWTNYKRVKRMQECVDPSLRHHIIEQVV